MIRNLLVFAILLFNSFNSYSQSEISADSLKKHVCYFAADSLEGRGLATESGVKAANYIAQYFEQIGLEQIGGRFLHPFYTRVGQSMLIGNNVVGVIEGTDPILKDEYIVLGAHYDHISFIFFHGEKVVFNGADDNATGTAAIIELGRSLVQQKENLKRSVIIVAFDAEESGLIGSGEFVKQALVPVENIKLMMSIDMIGRYAESNSLIMGAMGTLQSGDEILFKIAEEHKIAIKKTGKKISSGTDSKPFGQEGIPALHVTSGIVGPYHKPEDDAETIDYEGMSKISGLLFDLTVELSNKESLEPINKLAALAKNDGMLFFRYGVKGNFGVSYHSYPNNFFNGKKRLSAEIGLITQLKLTKNFSLQPEVLYSTLASDFNLGAYRTHCVSVPVSLVLGTKMDREYDQRFFVKLGGYYSYHFSGSVGGESMDFDNAFEQTETGLVYEIGMEYMSIVVGLSYKHGLSNLGKDASMGEFVNRATYFTMGYIF